MPAETQQHPHGPLRRKEREIRNRAEIDDILSQGKVLHLALSDDNIPFLVPVFYAYTGSVLYFHCAKAGAKVEIMKHNPLVCFEVSVDHGILESESPCDFEARHRTVIGLGTANFVEDEAEKIKALDMIVGRFTDKRFTYPKANLKVTAVVRIEISSIKGKKHGF